MSDALCLPHKNRGFTALAHRLVNGTPMCADCFAGKEIAPAPKADEDFPLPAKVQQKADEVRERKTMSKWSHVDLLALQNDRSDGKPVKEIAAKHKVPEWFVHQKTKAPENGARRATAVARVKSAGPREKKQIAVHALAEIAAAIDVLRVKRAEIDEVIEKLESLKLA
jgi:hypothetical protein